MFIDVKLNNINEFKIIDLKEILFIKEKLYLSKYRIRFNSLRDYISYYRKLLLFVRK